MKYTILIGGGVLLLGGIKGIYNASTESSYDFYLGVLSIICGFICCYLDLLNQNESKL